MPKVLGYTQDHTNCDCCGRKNLKGTFAVETDHGDVLHYGSVCVNRVYGRKGGEAIKSKALVIHQLQTIEWNRLISAYARGVFPNYVISVDADGRHPMTNSRADMARVVAFKIDGAIVRRITGE